MSTCIWGLIALSRAEIVFGKVMIGFQRSLVSRISVGIHVAMTGSQRSRALSAGIRHGRHCKGLRGNVSVASRLTAVQNNFCNRRSKRPVAIAPVRRLTLTKSIGELLGCGSGQKCKSYHQPRDLTSLLSQAISSFLPIMLHHLVVSPHRRSQSIATQSASPLVGGINLLVREC